MREEWETILDVKGGERNDIIESTERLRVPGGWLYRIKTWGGDDCACDGLAICFAPDSKDKDE